MRVTKEMISAVMSEIGRKGGKAVSAALTPEQRREKGRRAGASKVLKCTCGHCPTCYQREYQRKRRAKAREG